MSGTTDVWGCEQDMLMPCLAPILHNTQETVCNSHDCPQKKKVNESQGIFIVAEDTEKKDSVTKLEALLNQWLCPDTSKCDVLFENAPETAQTRMSEPRLSLSENYWYRSQLCDGSRAFQRRELKNGAPWVLPVFFGDLAMTGYLKGPEDLPEVLQICNSTYCLTGITFWSGTHYNTRIRYNNKWYTYDGLQSVPLQPVPVYSAPVQARYTMSSCVYFKK